MAKKKVTKKAVVKKVARPVRKTSSSSYGKVSKKNPVVIWLMIFVAAVLVLAFWYHHKIDEKSANEGSVKNGVMKMINLDNDAKVNDDAVMTVTPTPADNSTITPYVTVAPTDQPQY